MCHENKRWLGCSRAIHTNKKLLFHFEINNIITRINCEMSRCCEYTRKGKQNHFAEMRSILENEKVIVFG